MRWKIIVEEFVPELIYIPGEKNIEANTLSQLSMWESSKIADYA